MKDGNITAVHVTYDPETKSGGKALRGRKVKGTIHWVHADSAVRVTARLYENIIDEEKGVYDENGELNLNPHSLTVCDAFVEPELKDGKGFRALSVRPQRLISASTTRTPPKGALYFNRIVGLGEPPRQASQKIKIPFARKSVS